MSRRVKGLVVASLWALFGACGNGAEDARDEPNGRSSALISSTSLTGTSRASTSGASKSGASKPVATTSVASSSVASAQITLAPTFVVRSALGRCFDFGGAAQPNGTAVVLRDCTTAASQQIVVEEINERHEVVLHAGNQVLGVRSPPVLSTSVLEANVTAVSADSLLSAAGSGSSSAASPTSSSTTAAISTEAAFVAPPLVSGATVVTEGAITYRLPAAALALELQARANPVDPAARKQVFSLDGDSIILASDRTMVAQADHGQGGNGARVVMGPRNLSDAELWDFVPADGIDRDPTSGFTRVSTPDGLLDALMKIDQIAEAHDGAAWGNVIKVIDTGTPIDLHDETGKRCAGDPPWQCRPDPAHGRINIHDLKIPTGVTVRGDRRALLRGPLIVGNYAGCQPKDDGETPSCEYDNVFHVLGDFTRITGLRLKGPSDCLANPGGCHSTNLPPVIGIQIGGWYKDPIGTVLQPTGVIVDRNDVFDWPEAAVNLGDNAWALDACPTADGLMLPFDRAVVARNFLHHNENNDGYGVGLYRGGTATIRENTFLMNRHSISGGEGEGHERFVAAFNLIQSDVPVYGDDDREQDFDMHGSNDEPHYGGIAGSKVVIHANTFLGGDRDNFDLRGQPCNGTDDRATMVDVFDANVTMSVLAGRIWDRGGGEHPLWLNGPAPSEAPYISLGSNQHLWSNPTDHLGVGDFDGDGKDDLFVATGASWYYAPAGMAEWRFLNAQADPLDRLLFGDFDGDGRTDVFTQHGRDWLVSWGGATAFQTINASDAQLGDFAVGNFDGDARADIFYADGQAWYLSSGGTGAFKALDVSSFRAKDLRFADFDGDGKTDVLGVTGGLWQIESGAARSWQRLNDKLTDSLSGLVVADLDGDGIADVGRMICALTSCYWQVSTGGRTAWRTSAPPIAGIAAVGRFEGNRWANLLGWNGGSLVIADANATGPASWGRFEMR